MSIRVATGKDASFGILFKNADAIEEMRKVDTLVIDKTGTLTEGKPKLVDIVTVGGASEDSVLMHAVAIGSAAITLVSGDLMGIARARHLSRATMRNIKEGLFFAFAYNIVDIPIAAGALYRSFGLLLSPMLAAGAMSLSSVSVVANALRLRRVKL